MKNDEFAPVPGQAVQLCNGLSLILAPNPSPMTYLGTNSYVLGHTSLAIIDPGPLSESHLEALLREVGNRTVSHIVLTHSHLDHSPLARPLAKATGGKIVAFGDSSTGRSKVMNDLAAAGYAGGGEGMDWDFTPDQTIAHGDTINGVGWSLKAIHTPGHIGNHLCYLWDDKVFSGDHVMGWSTSLVSPPDGDMSDFMASCARLMSYDATVYYPGHGAPVYHPHTRVAELVAHRKARTDQICVNLRQHGSNTVAGLTALVYADLAPALFPAASRNVFAHLIDLHQQEIVTASPVLSHDAVFTISDDMSAG